MITDICLNIGYSITYAQRKMQDDVQEDIKQEDFQNINKQTKHSI